MTLSAQREDPSATAFRVAAIVLGVAAVVLLTIAALSFRNARDALATEDRVDGVVVDMEESRSNHDGRMHTGYTPVVEYAVDGLTYTMMPNSSSNPPTHEIGDHVELIVDADAPGEARMVRFMYLPAIILGGVGLICGVITAAIVVICAPARRKRWRRPAGLSPRSGP